MIIECQKCGAPLEADGTQMFVVCQYCELSNKVASSRTLAMQSPVNWQPPPQWTPGQQWNASQYGAPIATAASGAAMTGLKLSGCITGVTLLMMLLIGGAVFLIVMRATGAGGDLFASGWDGEEPLRCSMNDHVRIEGVTANLPNETAIQADMNCEVTIVDSEITAYRGIEASGNGTIRLENTTIHASDIGVRVEINKRLELVNSTVIADGVGVEATINADVMVQGGRVQGSPQAVRMGMNGQLDNRGGELIDAP